MPSTVCEISCSRGSRMRGSRRQIHAFPSHGSRMTSSRQSPVAGSRTQVWWLTASASSVGSAAFESTSTYSSKSASCSRTTTKAPSGIPISRSSCSRVCSPRKRSSDQPAMTAHGTSTPARRCATSAGSHASHFETSGSNGSWPTTSDSAAPAEQRKLDDARPDDESGRDADRPVRLVERPLEVLPVVTNEQRRHEDEGRDHGQLPADVALALRDPRVVVVTDTCEQVARDVELLGDPEERLGCVREEQLDGGREQPVVSDVHAARDDSAHCAARPRDGAAH